jgi:hypothetical protein
MSIEVHAYEQRYRAVFDRSRELGHLATEQVDQSRFYFDFATDPNTGLSIPVPKTFDTYGVVALMPMSHDVQDTLSATWENTLASLGQPLAYGVEPDKRHVELILFSRPEEIFDEATIDSSIGASFAALKESPPASFNATFRSPFITPDGTVVVPGFPEPVSAIDDFRASVRRAVGDTIPERQSRWFHISLGRILEAMDATTMEPTLQVMEDNWGEQLASVTVDKIMWTHEKQWYMMQKDILHELPLN